MIGGNTNTRSCNLQERKKAWPRKNSIRAQKVVKLLNSAAVLEGIFDWESGDW
jgi:hypothetical protein